MPVLPGYKTLGIANCFADANSRRKDSILTGLGKSTYLTQNQLLLFSPENDTSKGNINGKVWSMDARAGVAGD